MTLLKAFTVFCGLLLLVGAPAVLGAGLSPPVQPVAQVHADKSSFYVRALFAAADGERCVPSRHATAQRSIWDGRASPAGAGQPWVHQHAGSQPGHDAGSQPGGCASRRSCGSARAGARRARGACGRTCSGSGGARAGRRGRRGPSAGVQDHRVGRVVWGARAGTWAVGCKAAPRGAAQLCVHSRRGLCYADDPGSQQP